MTAFTGGCLCGAIRYRAAGDPIASGACHCRDCQYVSGGAPAHVIIMLEGDVTITKGNPRACWSTSVKGNRVARHFCGECGTPLFAENAAHPEFLPIKIGSLDDPSWFRPGGHIWVSSAQPWHHIDSALPQWDKDPT